MIQICGKQKETMHLDVFTAVLHPQMKCVYCVWIIDQLQLQDDGRMPDFYLI